MIAPMPTPDRDRAGRARRSSSRSGTARSSAAAAALAALDQLDGLGGPVVLIVTGRNIDDELHLRGCRQPETFPD